MKRLHLFEIEDQVWCPTVIRDCLTDYLQHVITATNAYGPIVGRLEKAVTQAKASRIVDLASGRGGSWLGIEQTFREYCPGVEIYLTDLHHNQGAMKRAETLSSGRIKFDPDPVNALQVPPE